MLVYGPLYAKYATQTTFYFSLEDVSDAEAPFTGTAPLTADIWLFKDGGAAAAATNAFTAISNGLYSWVATATELTCTQLNVNVYDATASAIFKPLSITIRTKLQLGQIDADATGLSNTHGIVATGVGTGSGISATGGSTGNGMVLNGGASSGDGLKSTSTAGNGNGINTIGVGTGYGLLTTGASSTYYNNVLLQSEGTAPSAAIGSTATFGAILQHLKRRWFNKTTVDGTSLVMYADDSSTTVSTQTVSDDGSTDTIGKAS